MLRSTEGPTIPSVTLSNYEPLTRLGFQYEFFWARMKQAGEPGQSGDNILYNGKGGIGNPRIFGTHVSTEPFPGWSIGFNRLLQYCSGTGMPNAASFLPPEFFKPHRQRSTHGNSQSVDSS